MHSVILFDGACHFCNKSVLFIIRRDKSAYFKFASLQSSIGQDLLKKHYLDLNIQSLVLIKNNQVYTQSTAALEISRNLTAPWPLFYILRVVPKYFRNLFYTFIAKHRLKISKSNVCDLSLSKEKSRFL